MAMDWTPIYSVGIDILDRQHQGLFAVITELQNELASSVADGGVARCLDRLRRYTREHFATEEALMAAAAYPQLASHRAQHAALCRRLDELGERLGADDPAVRDDLYFFLVSDWLATHILGADHGYRDCLRQAAIGESTG